MAGLETKTDFKLFTHKNNASEIFIKHMDIIDENNFIVKFRIYHKHKNYDDVTTTPELINPMYLLECCRQAETYIVHKAFCLPTSFRFILKSWWLSLIKENNEKIKKTNHDSITIHIKSVSPISTSIKLRSNSYLFIIKVGEVPIGEAGFNVSYIPGEIYLKLRGGLSSDNRQKENESIALQAKSLGYKSQINAMIYNPVFENKICQATLHISEDNTTYNDHYQDHVTGINLVEATKQFCFYYLSEVIHSDISGFSITNLHTTFEKYIENNLLTFLVIENVKRHDDGRYEFIVSVIQEGKCKALCVIKLGGLLK
ncbi:MAG: AfsA-related hotdog domain-containing protein [Serratia sp. (in: enterobacteria)]|uniref:AfsA-related hotdog domain-containing protein n=1 Tax=Serratia sp. (in: enterobacteria) TaxID=616 RepID=UPI003F2D4701